jgi:hypothetical protein
MSTVAARAASGRSAPGPDRRSGDRRAALQVVARRTSRVARPKLLPIVAAGIVAASLFAVVIGHAVLAQDQLRLATVQSAITAAQATHRREVVSVANLENPSRIVEVAEQSLHMVTPSTVDQLPYVTLHKALPPPSVAPAAPGTTPLAGTGG